SGHGDTRRGTILGDGSFRNVDVEVMVLEELVIDSQFFGLAASIAECSLSRLLHNLSQLAGQQQIPFPAHGRGLTKHDLAPCARPCHPCRHSDLVLLEQFLRMYFRGAEILAKTLRTDSKRPFPAFCDFASYLAADRADFPFQVAQTGLPRVLGD